MIPASVITSFSLISALAHAVSSVTYTTDQPFSFSASHGSNTHILALDNGVDWWMQADGNFVAYQNGQAVWDAGCGGRDCNNPDCHLDWTDEGGFGIVADGTTIWDTNTAGAATTLVLSNSGDFVTLYDAQGVEVSPQDMRPEPPPGDGPTNGCPEFGFSC